MNKEIKTLVDRFLSWPLPASVSSDDCVTNIDYPHQRVGTNLLTADEAAQMLTHVIGPELAQRDRDAQRLRKMIPGCDCADPKQCWEPCGTLGHDERYTVPAAPSDSAAER